MKTQRTDQHKRHGAATEKEGEILIGPGKYAITEKMRWRTPPDLVAALQKEFGAFDLDATAEDGCATAPRWITVEEDALNVDWRLTYREKSEDRAACPTCGTVLEKVRYPGGHLNRDQWESQRAGDWTCSTCPPNGRAAQDTAAYFWNKEVKFLSVVRHHEKAPQHSPLFRVGLAFTNPPWGINGVPGWVKDRNPHMNWNAFPGTGAFLRAAWRQSRNGLTVLCLVGMALDTDWQKPMIQLSDEVRFGKRFQFHDHLGVPGPQPPAGHMLLVFRPHVPPTGWPGGPRADWDWKPI